MMETNASDGPRPDASVSERLDVALEAVRLAIPETLRWFGASDLTVDEKVDHSPVTQADRAAEAQLRATLLARFPHDGFLGEETGTVAGSSGFEWIVDPIDGTKSFIQGVPLFAMLVGCRQQGKGVLGIVAIPALAELVYATTGGGAWHVQAGGPTRPARVSSRATLARAVLCSSDFTSFRRWSGGQQRGEAARGRLENDCGVCRTWGDGYGYFLVATGRADVMVDPLMNPWDAAAVETVVTEAGGRFTDWQGRPRIDSGDGVASNGLLHDAVLQRLGTGG